MCSIDVFLVAQNWQRPSLTRLEIGVLILFVAVLYPTKKESMSAYWVIWDGFLFLAVVTLFCSSCANISCISTHGTSLFLAVLSAPMAHNLVPLILTYGWSILLCQNFFSAFHSPVFSIFLSSRRSNSFRTLRPTLSDKMFWFPSHCAASDIVNGLWAIQRQGGNMSIYYWVTSWFQGTTSWIFVQASFYFGF